MTAPSRPAFWQLPAALQGLPEAQLREESIGADTVLLHITFPKDTDTERVTNFARAFSRELPKNVKAVFTEDDIGITVHRPRTVSLQITNNTIFAEDLLDQIKQLVADKDVTQVQIALHGNNIMEKPEPILKIRGQSPTQPGSGTLSGGSNKVAGEKPRRRGVKPTSPKTVELVKEK